MVRAPGRVTIIGEHTDYNAGLALPGAVDRSVWLAMRRNNAARVRIEALDLHRSYDEPLVKSGVRDARWPRYLLGVVDVIREMGIGVSGFDLAYGSDIPAGAGLSSSVALACGTTFGLSRLFGFDLDDKQIVRAARLVEERYVGTRPGNLDPISIVYGRSGRVLLLDFQDETQTPISFPRNLRIVLCDSCVERSQYELRYNERRSQCETAVTILRQRDRLIRTLRDVRASDVNAHAEALGKTLVRRCNYVIAENERVIRAGIALARGEQVELGKLLLLSHRGLRTEYEVSCAPVDRLVDYACSQEGVLGARMMGTGFGGCTINLVQADALDSFLDAMRRFYRETMHRAPRVIQCGLSGGVERVA